jgi:hypothetical protein
MARPGQAIATALSRIFLIFTRTGSNTGDLAAVLLKSNGRDESLNRTERKTDPRNHPETIRPI